MLFFFLDAVPYGVCWSWHLPPPPPVRPAAQHNRAQSEIRLGVDLVTGGKGAVAREGDWVAQSDQSDQMTARQEAGNCTVSLFSRLAPSPSHVVSHAV